MTGAYWVEQVRAPVRFAAALSAAALNADTLLEVGPGTTLLGLARQCLGDAAGVPLPSLRRAHPDVARMLESLATLWTAGMPVDWGAVHRDGSRRRVSLPTYAFQRERYWLPASSAVSARSPRASTRSASASAHPLLGSRLPSPLASVQFETELRADAPTFLSDHRIAGDSVVPGTAYVEMMGAAVEAVRPGPLTLQDLTLQQSLVIPAGEARTVQVVVMPEAGAASIEVWSRTGEAASEPWRLHASGQARFVATSPPSPTQIERIRAGLPEELSAAAFYGRLDGRVLALGPSFRAVTRVWRGKGEALGEIHLPEAAVDAPRYRMHPGLLDACVQLIDALVPDDLSGDTTFYMPMAIDRFRILERPGERVWSSVRLTSPPGDTLSADIQVLDDGGNLVAEMTGLRLRRTDSARATGEPTQIADWLYTIDWKPAPLPATAPSGEELERWAAAEIERWRGDEAIARYGAALGELDRLTAVYIVQALEQIGGSLARGGVVRPDSMVDTGSVLPRYRPLLIRLLTILAEDGVLRPTATGWVVEREPQRRDLRVLEQELNGRGIVSPELALLRRCGPRLADVLRGTCDPLSLIFANGSFEMAERLYCESPMAQALGALVRETVLGFRSRTPGRPLRILEVGGGTGGTTGVVLPAVAQGPCEYVFTDISRAFTGRAAARFAAYPFFRVDTLDVETDPLAQGFAAEHFDVIIAADVIHATADLRRTLEHCRRLLAPGGLLIMVEVTVPQRWVDLVFGLTDGWWKFSDVELRPDYPLMSSDRWTALLAESGFGVSRTLPDPSRVEGPAAEQAVIVGVRDGESTRPERHQGGAWLVLSDRGGLGDRLTAALRARGDRCHVLRAGDGYGIDADGITVDPESPDQMRQALRAVGRDGSAPPRGVVHLWGLDASSDLDAGVASEDPLRVAAGALHLVQGLLEITEAGTRLSLVTRGAHRLPEDAGVPAVIQAPLWGLGRTIALEHPELRCQCVDLDPSPAADPLPALLAEITSAPDENESAWRGTVRFAARLARWSSPPSPIPAATGPVRLEATSQGRLESLVLRPMSRRTPGPGEVEIRVRAAGLNFKDVLSALDLYPGAPGPLGGECAGTVVAVGSGVEGLAVGTEVVALASGALATHVTVDAALVVPRPASLSVEEAASLPVAYVTAAYTLSTVGGMKAGERVLIHAGAGGVGLAGIMLARRVGATVLATAGSPQKRAFLEKQGVAHVFDSRSLDFREGVMAATAGRGVDLVLNSLSGAAIDASLSIVAHHGRFVEIGKRGILDPTEVRRRRPDVAYSIVDWTELARVNPGHIRRHLCEIVDGVGSGAIPAPPVTRFSLAAAPDAFRHMAQARHIGKIVLAVPRDVEPEPTIRPDASYLVTGGFGGLGIEVARRLADRGARHLVLMGRHAPSEAAAAALASLRQAGVEVSAVEADVADEHAVARLVADVERTPWPLRGIVHAAGTLDNAVLARQDVGRFARVMAAKIVGTWHLDRATRGLPLDFFVLFSSTAGVFGSAGQANHAAANVFLDAMAQHRQARGLPAVSVDWGAWSDVGAAATGATARRVALDGMSHMRPDEALTALERAMAADEAQMAIFSVDWVGLMTRRAAAGELPSLLRSFRSATPPAPRVSMPTPAAPELLSRLEAAAPSRRRQLLAEHVAGRVVRVLGGDLTLSIDHLRPLKELGIDSLMAVELRNGLKADLRLDGGLPATLVFDHPTVEAIAEYLDQEVLSVGSEKPGRAAAPREAAAADSMLSRLEQLSDDEVDRLLHERERNGRA